MSAKGGQILRLVSEYREELVRERVEASGTFTNVVDATRESRPRQSLALLSFDGDRVTHAALGTRTQRVATGQVRIRYDAVRELSPLHLSDIAAAIPVRLRRYFESSLDGWLPARTWEACLAIVRRDSQNDQAIRELENDLSRAVLTIPARQLRTFEEERDALGLALQIFDPGSGIRVPGLSSLSRTDAPFLAAIHHSGLPEDVAVAHDTRVFDGWLPRDVPAVGAVTFENRGRVLTVANVNRSPIERTLGVDLLYFSAEYRSFIFVQYKRMVWDKSNRAYYRPRGASYLHEYERMIAWDQRLRSNRLPSELDGYRLGSDAFFFKLYANPRETPPPTGLLRGMYLPLSYWTQLVTSASTLGPRGGRLITYENAKRHLTSRQFADLVGSGWLGTMPRDESMLTRVIADALDAGHSVTVAVSRPT